MRHSIRLVPACLLAGLVLAAPAMARPAATKLTGTVGPGFTISLAKAGKKVTKLKAGTYTITVSDKASIHNFHLFGPSLNKTITSIPFVGKKTVTVTLKKGTYTYQCDAHASMGMKATLKVS